MFVLVSSCGITFGIGSARQGVAVVVVIYYVVYDKSIVHSGKYIIIFSNKYAAYIKGDLNVLSQNSFHIHHFIIA